MSDLGDLKIYDFGAKIDDFGMEIDDFREKSSILTNNYLLLKHLMPE